MNHSIEYLRLSPAKMNEIAETVNKDPLILKMRADAFVNLHQYITHDQKCQIRDNQMIHEIDIDLENMQLRWAYLKGHHDGQLDALQRMHNAAVMADNEITTVYNKIAEPLVDKALKEEEANHE